MAQQSKPKQVKLVPADQELKKFINSGGRPAAKTYFDDVLHRAATPPAQATGQTSVHPNFGENTEKRIH